jgi:hypothetical protein
LGHRVTAGWLLKHSPLKAVAQTLTTVVLTLVMLAFVPWVSLRVNSAAQLARICAWISLAYLLVASPDYWGPRMPVFPSRGLQSQSLAGCSG